VARSDPAARETVYGTPYGQWKAPCQKDATAQQQAGFDAAHRHQRQGQGTGFVTARCVVSPAKTSRSAVSELFAELASAISNCPEGSVRDWASAVHCGTRAKRYRTSSFPVASKKMTWADTASVVDPLTV
jgi:hypothetical protein